MKTVGPNSPDPLNEILTGSFCSAEPPAGIPEFTLVNWNIERGKRWPEMLDAFQGLLRADLYLLQEVDVHAHRTGYRNVAEELARGSGMHYVFATEFIELAQGRPSVPARHGQAVLSRWPLVGARILRFQRQPYDWGPRWKPRWAWLQPRRGGRMALVVEIRARGRSLVVYDVHIESQADEKGRAEQMREVLEDVASRYPPNFPVIIAGDFNTRSGADSPVVAELTRHGFLDALADYPGDPKTSFRKNRRGDWIFVRHLNYRDGKIPELRLSDHFPITLRFSLPVPQ